MIELAIAAMAIVAIAVIAYPLLRSSLGSDPDDAEEASPPEGAPGLADLTAQRDTLYRAVKEIEFEYALGSLSGEDYRDLRERYKTKALGVIKAIHDQEETPQRRVDDAGSAADVAAMDAELEDAVRRRRALSKAKASASRRLCRECGLEYGVDDNFCPNCGRRLALSCSQCGEPCGPTDQFCARCGAMVGTADRARPRRAVVSTRR